MKSGPKRPSKLVALRSSLLQKHEPWSIGRTHFRSEIRLDMVQIGQLGTGNSMGLSKFCMQVQVRKKATMYSDFCCTLRPEAPFHHGATFCAATFPPELSLSDYPDILGAPYQIILRRSPPLHASHISQRRRKEVFSL